MNKEKKIPYEEAKIETVEIAKEDVITTSNEELGEGDDVDGGAWTNP